VFEEIGHGDRGEGGVGEGGLFESSLEDGARAEEQAGAGGGVGGVFYAEGLEAFGGGELEEVAGGAADVEDAGGGEAGAGW